MAYQDTILAAAPLAYWRLGETSDTQAADLSGNGYHGTYTGTITRGVQGALQGDADGGIYGGGSGVSSVVNIGQVSALEFAGSTNFCIEAWYRSNPTTGTSAALFRSHATHGINLELSGMTSDYPVVSLWFRNQAGGGNAVSAYGVPRDDRWHHIVAGFSGGVVSIYIDTQLITQQSITNIAVYPSGADRVSAIGPGYTALGFVAGIDEVAIYGRMLTLSEIQARYSQLRFQIGWRQKPSPHTGHQQRVHPGSFVLGGKLYMITGRTSTAYSTGTNSVWAYDPATATMTQKANYSASTTETRGASAAGLGYGYGGVTTGSSVLGTFLRYDETANTWTSLTSSTGRYGGVFAYGVHPALGAGFYSGFGNSTAFQFFSIANSTWNTLATSPASQGYVRGLVGDDNNLYVFGGATNLNVLRMYDPVTNTWSTKANATNGRQGHGWIKKDGLFWAIGGNTAGTQSTVDAYNPSNNTWAAKEALGVAHGNGVTEIVQGRLYAMAGDKNGTGNPSLQYYIDPPLQATATLTGSGVVLVPRYFATATLTGTGDLAAAPVVAFDEVTAPGFIDMGHVTPQLPDGT